MPSKKKNSKGKARKAAGKSVTKHGEEANEQKQGTLDSQMQRLQIEGKQQAHDDEDALLEEAIKLAAAEKKDIEEKEKANCKHGYNPSSSSQDRLCTDYMRKFMTSLHAAKQRGEGMEECITSAFAETTMEMCKTFPLTKSAIKCIISWCLADGVKLILEGIENNARLVAVVATYLELLIVCTTNLSDSVDFVRRGKITKLNELMAVDEHTVVQFFRKRIPCSCLDEKHKEVMSITKMGLCMNQECPLPGNKAVRSKMVYCTKCRVANYCSRECQVIDWPGHKKVCKLVAT